MDEITLTPIYRVEHFLDAIVNSTDCPYEARDRIELFLERIAGADIVTPEPQYRIEFYLAKIAGDDVEIPAPQHRAEFYLAALCGEDVELPDPHDRIDYWLYQWAQGGGMPDWQTFSGNPLQFNAPKAHTLRSTTVEFAPQQDLHGYDAPWPAGGGANKWDGEIESGRLNTQTGEPSATTPGKRSKNFIPVSPSTTYYVHSGGNINVFVLEYAEDETFIRYVDWFRNGTYTTGATAHKIKFYTTSDSDYDKISINYPATVTTYSPYSNECPISGWTGVDIYNEPEYDPTATPKLTVTWQDEAGTVYGGYLLINEDGSVDVIGEKAKYVATGSSTMSGGSFAEGTDTCRVFIPGQAISPSMKPNATNVKAIMADNLSPFNPDYIYSNDVEGVSENKNATTNGLWIRISKTRLSEYTQDGVKAYLTNNPLSVVYPIATPVTYHLPSLAEAIRCLKGINTMWTDGDNLTVEARGEAVNLNALQSLNMLLGGRYYNNHTEDDLSDKEALDVILGGQR